MSSKVDMSKFKKSLQAVIEEFEKPQTMREMGEYAVERIVLRTRLGKGVSEKGDSASPLKPLSESYRQQRKGKLAFYTTKDGKKVPYIPKIPPILDATTSPTKSNLTFTGQLLNSIKVISVKAGKVLIAPTGKRSDRRSKISGATNREVAGYVSEERPFLNLSKSELLALNRFVREKIEALIKKLK